MTGRLALPSHNRFGFAQCLRVSNGGRVAPLFLMKRESKNRLTAQNIPAPECANRQREIARGNAGHTKATPG